MTTGNLVVERYKNMGAPYDTIKHDEFPFPYLTYGEAIELCKKGVDVACATWELTRWLTYHPTGNSSNSGPHFVEYDYGQLAVSPIHPRSMHTGWIIADYRRRLESIVVGERSSETGLIMVGLNYKLMMPGTPEYDDAIFKDVYRLIGTQFRTPLVLSENPDSVLKNLVSSMEHAYRMRRNLAFDQLLINEEGVDITGQRESSVKLICSTSIDDTIKRIESGEIYHVVIDTDSFKDENSLVRIKQALEQANSDFASLSLKEQLPELYRLFD